MNFFRPAKQFIKRYWQGMLSIFTLLLVVTALAALTTATDDLSTASSENLEVVTPRLSSNDFASTSSTTEEVATSSQDSSAETPAVPADPFAVSVVAESAVVWDVERQQVLFAKNPDKEQPLASLTKLMTALVAADLISGEDKEPTTVISRQHLRALGSSGLIAGQTWNIYDLISFMLIESSNDAARAVAASASADPADGYAKEFIEQMNQTARMLGLTTTYFFNPSGLDLNETLISGGYGSAEDVARLFSHIIKTNQAVLTPTTQSRKIFTSKEGLSYVANNTNTWLPQFQNILGSKTGYTVLAGGNLVMGFALERPIVIVVLGSTKAGRFGDMKTLYEASQQYLAQEQTAGAETQP
jgi:D-alanyl-D-alanine carboxypeptidase